MEYSLGHKKTNKQEYDIQKTHENESTKQFNLSLFTCST